MSGAGQSTSFAGGRAHLAGTFIAEQTHSSPAAYSLLSTTGGSQKRNDSKPTSGGSGAGCKGKLNSNQRGARLEKGGMKCTRLDALTSLEPLLDQSESAAVARHVSKCSPGGSPVAAATAAATAPPRPSGAPASARKGRRGGSRASTAGSRKSRSSESPRAKARELKDAQTFSSEGGPCGPEEARCKAKVAAPEVFARLYTPQRPEVALQTNCQLLAWLSKRGRDPEIASTRPSTMASTMDPTSPSPGVSCEVASCSWASPLSSRCASRRHESNENHTAFFDRCLRKAPGACPTTPRPKPRPESLRSASANPEHSGHHLAESLQVIDVLAEFPVDEFLRSENMRAHTSMERERFGEELPELAQTAAGRARILLSSAAARAQSSRAQSALG